MTYWFLSKNKNWIIGGFEMSTVLRMYDLSGFRIVNIADIWQGIISIAPHGDVEDIVMIVEY